MLSEKSVEKSTLGRPKVRENTVTTLIRIEESLYDQLCAIAYKETKIALSEKRNRVSINEVMNEGLRMVVEKLLG